MKPAKREAFYIEDHALLYGLFGKYTELYYGPDCLRKLEQATIRYCRERGARMAARCRRDGRDLSMQSFLLYAEYADTRRLSRSETRCLIPQYLNIVTACAWNDVWQKYGLGKYGAIYCSVCDANVLYGFSPLLQVKLSSVLSHGDDCCSFTWCDANFASEEEFKALMTRKYTNAAHNMRDFLYHSAHLLSTMRSELRNEPGPQAEAVISSVLEEYTSIMGEDKYAALQAEAQKDFTEIDT